MSNLASVLKSKDITLVTKVHLVKATVFPVVMYGSVVLEKILESPLDNKEIQPIHPKGNQSWIFIGMTDAEAETPILWPPDVKNWLIGKDPDAGKEWRWEEKGTIEDEMVGWHFRLNGDEFEQALGVGDGQRNLLCCSPWDCKESDLTERLNWSELNCTMLYSHLQCMSDPVSSCCLHLVLSLCFLLMHEKIHYMWLCKCKLKSQKNNSTDTLEWLNLKDWQCQALVRIWSN